MKDTVVVTNMASAQVGFTVPDLRISKNWPKKGTKLKIEKDLLREAIYDPGIEYLFKQGILYIEDADLDFKIELGLEPEGSETSENILKMSDENMSKLLRETPLEKLKETIDGLSENQREEFLNYVLHQDDLNWERGSIIGQSFHLDIFKNKTLLKDLEE